MKIAGTAFLAVPLISGLLFVEIKGRRREGQPDNIICQAREIIRGRMEDDFGSGRGIILKQGMSVVWNNPVLGTGPYTFFFTLSGRQIESAEQIPSDPFPNIIAIEGFHLENHIIYGKAHNMFLEIAVCMGIPALLSFLVFLGGLFRLALKKAFDHPILLAFAASALCYVIQSFFR